MRVNRTLLVGLTALMAAIMAACSGAEPQSPIEPSAEPASPQPSEAPTDEPQMDPTEGAAMIRGNVFLDNSELQVKESYPVQLSLSLEGNLPTPCHQLQYEVTGADEEGSIQVEVWSEAPAGQECIQVLEPFEEDIPLGTATEGSFTVFVNGEEVGNIDL